MRVADVALVEFYVFLGEIGGVERGLAFAEVQVDVQVKLRRRDGRAQCFKGRRVGLPFLRE